MNAALRLSRLCRPGLFASGLIVGLLALAGCVPAGPQPDVTSRSDGVLTGALPPMKTFGGGWRTDRPLRPNSAIARDFMELTFQLESGRALPVFTRFDGPVTVRVEGRAPASFLADLDRLILQLRHEAGIDIRRISSGEAGITVVTITRAELQRSVPQAACFVSPRISSWAEFRSPRNAALADWTTLRSREKMAVFIPWDVAPQEARDCLHEELAQALGPLNDLYRLPDSVFNDDNFQAILTGFDMLILRASYSPDLQSGMTPQEVAARLPAILERLNPSGGRAIMDSPDPTPRAWTQAIETALGARTPASRRLASAHQAVTLAQSYGWSDTRRAFAHYVLGRLAIGTAPETAMSAFLQADAIFRSRPETRVQSAHVSLQMAAYALSSGDAANVLEITGRAIPVAEAAENAALLSQLMLMRAAALDYAGRSAEAGAVRNEALGWARYGFGSDNEVRARAGEIASLAPRRPARQQVASR